MSAAPIKDGGPAFPVSEILAPDGSHERWAEDGMSLRDYFAAKALPQVMSMCHADTRAPGEAMDTFFARRSYEMADAMLKARQA